MNLSEMTDSQFEAIIKEVTEIQYLIVTQGGMATKSLVEDVLMARHKLSRGDAHTFTNTVESQNKQEFRFRAMGIVWVANRPAPTLEKYPELVLVMKERTR